MISVFFLVWIFFFILDIFFFCKENYCTVPRTLIYKLMKLCQALCFPSCCLLCLRCLILGWFLNIFSKHVEPDHIIIAQPCKVQDFFTWVPVWRKMATEINQKMMHSSCHGLFIQVEKNDICLPPKDYEVNWWSPYALLLSLSPVMIGLMFN